MDWTHAHPEGSPPLVILGEDSPEGMHGAAVEGEPGSVADWRRRVALLEAAGGDSHPPPLAR